VTGVQTCALPISGQSVFAAIPGAGHHLGDDPQPARDRCTLRVGAGFDFCRGTLSLAAALG